MRSVRFLLRRRQSPPVTRSLGTGGRTPAPLHLEMLMIRRTASSKCQPFAILSTVNCVPRRKKRRVSKTTAKVLTMVVVRQFDLALGRRGEGIEPGARSSHLMLPTQYLVCVMPYVISPRMLENWNTTVRQ
jgi:hypothetical protein